MSPTVGRATLNAPARGSSSAETASMCARSGESPLRDGLRVIGRRPSDVRLNRNSATFEHIGFCKQGGPVLDTRQARRVSGSWRMAAGRRRSARSRGSEGLCPEPDPENRAAISIRSARPPIITVIGGLAAPDRQHHWLSVAAEVIVRPLAVPARPERPGTAAQMVSPATGRRSQRKPGRRT